LCFVTAFGQSSNSPFGTTQPAFGQTSNASNNPFAPKPFGSPTTPFGAQTGSSIFVGTSTGMFGTPQTSSFSATNAFGSSTPAFGASSTPAFGASSTPAFGASSSSAFGGKFLFLFPFPPVIYSWVMILLCRSKIVVLVQ
jgi:nuclear pore complex protein Nup98-Nup96